MIKLRIKDRIAISVILTLFVFILCLIFNFDIWKTVLFGLGSFAYQSIDHIVAYYRFDKK